MKKHLLLFVFAFAAMALHAQDEDLYSMVHQDMSGYGFGIESVTQQRNGDIIKDQDRFINTQNEEERV